MSLSSFLDSWLELSSTSFCTSRHIYAHMSVYLWSGRSAPPSHMHGADMLMRDLSNYSWSHVFGLNKITDKSKLKELPYLLSREFKKCTRSAPAWSTASVDCFFPPSTSCLAASSAGWSTIRAFRTAGSNCFNLASNASRRKLNNARSVSLVLSITAASCNSASTSVSNSASIIFSSFASCSCTQYRGH